MTEENAKTKWCPHARFNGDNIAESGDLAKCIASDCMMWEPYNYWVKDGRCCTKETEGAEAVGGGVCGLVTKECEGCRL